jgi:hypothetical protein
MNRALAPEPGRRLKDLAGRTGGCLLHPDLSPSWGERDPSVARKRLCGFWFRVGAPSGSHGVRVERIEEASRWAPLRVSGGAVAGCPL